MNLFLFVFLLGIKANCAQTPPSNDEDVPELKYLNKSVDPCENFYEFACGNYRNYHPRPKDLQVIDNFKLLEDELIAAAEDILTFPKMDDDPIALKKAKSAFASCIDTDYADGLPVPELSIVDEFGGMPLLGNTSSKFSWTDIGDMVAKLGVPLLFNYQILPHSFSETDFYLYVSQSEDDIFTRKDLDDYIEKDSLANPSLIRPPDYQKTYDEIIEEAFSENAQQTNSLYKMRKAGQQAPFDIFLKTISKRMLKVRNPWKSDWQLDNDLAKMAAFMRQLYRGGLIENDMKLEPLDYFPTLGALQNWTDRQFANNSEMDWMKYLGRVFRLSGVQITDNVTMMIADASMIYGTLNLVRNTDPDVVKNFAMLRVFLFMAPDSDAVIRQAFEDYYKAKNYALYPRREYCTRKILDASHTASFSFAVTYGYKNYGFDQLKLDKIIDLLNDIEDAFKDILHESMWMDQEAQDAAVKKLNNMLLLLAFPPFVDDKFQLDEFYENVRICEWDNYGNAQRIRAFRQAYLFSQLSKPRDRTFWDKSTFDVNAYYNRPNNRIVFPISMLNGVFFQGHNSSVVVDYGRIGAIIGHEITHGFDNSGKDYNEDGLQFPWWSDRTEAAFNARTECFIAQYNSYYVPEIGAYVNGKLSLNENLADNGGVRTAYRAYRKRHKQQGRTVANFTDDQLFFIGFATMWCSVESDTYLRKLNSGDYAPTRFRVNGALANMAGFSNAFNCPKQSPMNPERKCVLW